MLDKYEPIACHIHEMYQFAVMRKLWLDIVCRDVDRGYREVRILPIDVYTKEAGEFLRVRNQAEDEFAIRLDMIKTARWVSDGRLIE